jgi:hypothetical protein
MFRKLDAARIVTTAEQLARRIEERFPGSGLSRVGKELSAVTAEATALSAWLGRPHYGVRAVASVCIAGLVAVVLVAALHVRGETGFHGLSDWVQSLEAMVNDIIFVGIAVYFLLGLELRKKRARALEALHVLRSLAHIVDMHQLTKDPDRPAGGGDTASSPKRDMTPFELTRYLDYSSELLAIISKIAALYVQELPDPVTLEAASGVEELAGGLSRAIWQKIMILDRMGPEEAAREAIEPV